MRVLGDHDHLVLLGRVVGAEPFHGAGRPRRSENVVAGALHEQDRHVEALRVGEVGVVAFRVDHLTLHEHAAEVAESRQVGEPERLAEALVGGVVELPVVVGETEDGVDPPADGFVAPFAFRLRQHCERRVENLVERRRQGIGVHHLEVQCVHEGAHVQGVFGPIEAAGDDMQGELRADGRPHRFEPVGHGHQDCDGPHAVSEQLYRFSIRAPTDLGDGFRPILPRDVVDGERR